jgi:hypothetical protein
MIYHPEAKDIDLYGLIDYSAREDVVWLHGNADVFAGWRCRLNPLLNGQWVYELSMQRGQYSVWDWPIRGMFTERYEALGACIEELKQELAYREIGLEKSRELNHSR